MKLKYLIILFIFSLLSCNNSNELIGHWHISPENTSRKSFHSLDILNDTVAFLDKNSVIGKIKGTHLKKDKVWFFPGECGCNTFKYSIKGKKLYLENDLENWIGKRMDSCSKLFDFKNQYIKLDFDLPILVENRTKYYPKEFENTGSMQYIIIGKPKKNITKNTKYKLQLKDKICTIDDLPIWISVIKEMENNHQIIVKIIADKNVPIKELKPIINLLKENKLKVIFTLLKENYIKENEIFEYVKTDKMNFNENKLLKEILK